MSPRPLSFALCLLAALSWAPLPAQTEEAPKPRVSLEEVRALRQQTESNTGLSDELRESVLGLYDAAIGSLESAAAHERAEATSRREIAGMAGLIETLRAELGKPEPEPRLALPDNVTVEQAEGALARERSRLGANRSALREVERLAEDRTNSRNALSRSMGELDQKLESLSDELRVATQREVDPDLQRATRKNLQARREAALREGDMIRAKLALLDARGVLIPWQTDQAQRRVAHSEKLVELLRDATQSISRRDAELSLERTHEQCRAAAEQSPALGAAAAETEQFAEMLWGPAGVVIESEKTTRSILATRKHVSELERIVQLMRRKFEAFGHRGSITRWWPEVPEDFPLTGDVAETIDDLEQRIPEVQHKLIRFEQQRSRLRKHTEQILAGLDADASGTVDPELQAVARDLLLVRQDLLDELIQLFGRYSDQLIQLETISSHLMSEIERVQEFLYERLLWVRSVPRPVIPRPGDVAEAFLWVHSGPHVKRLAGSVFVGARQMHGKGLGSLAVLVLLLGLRRPVRRRMKRLAEIVGNPATDSFRATVEAVAYTVVLAAPLPLALYLASRLLVTSDVSTFLHAASDALYWVAVIAALLETMRQLLPPNGLVEAHFRWPSRITRPVYRVLRWPEIVFLVLSYYALLLAMAGMQLSSPAQLQAYNNSFGRVAFILAMVLLGSSLLGVFRPRRGESGTGRTAWMRPVYIYAYPAVMVTIFLPAILAVLGFYITGYLLAYQMLRTLWLVAGLLVLGGLLFRWYTTSRARVSTQPGDPATGEIEVPAADAQVRALFRFTIGLIAAIGLFGIWSEAVPALQILKRVQVWPRIVLIEQQSAGGLDVAAGSGESPQASTAEAATQGESSSPPTVPGTPASTSTSSDGAAADAPGSAPLTLWKLLQAALAALITVMLVRNLPGLIELVLRTRTLLDSGARIAFGTLLRYTIMILGVSISFGLLGISWSKVQWLAAALTFGLAFGLQEIVANFISGLILLMERPVRVGDAVTIGNLQGRVTRIRIRATTIALWDRSEMIVPNKEFIMTKLVNWTLSDSRRRIDIPLRVAYGADLQRVKEILVEVAGQHPEVFDDPPPQALLLEFGDDALRFELRFFVDFGQGLKTRDELHMAVDRAFREHGIGFALPQLNIQLPARRSAPPPESK